MLSYIDPQAIKWKDISPLIQKVIDKVNYSDRYTVNYVYKRLMDRTFQLWMTGTAIVITQIEVYPTGVKELNIFLVSGERYVEHTQSYKDEFKAIAKDKGCKYLTGRGRMGWKKPLSKYCDDLKIEYRYSLEI